MTLKSLQRNEIIKRLEIKSELYNRKCQNLARDDLSFFLEYESDGMWKPAPHLNLLCKKLEDIEKGNINRLMVVMPPRHGKSEICSKKFPAWYLGKHPDHDVITSSYSADLALDFSEISRNTIRDKGHIFGKKLSSETSAKKRWRLSGYRGGLTASGVGGPITGRGADVAIIDDPIKNWEEARSEVQREKIWKWYQTVLRTRLTPNGAIVLIMTRWHEDDLAGRLLKAEGKKWDILHFPAIAEKKDILGRKSGEALWPERYPLSELNDIKETMLKKLWLALYQGEPRTDEEGALWNYEMFRYVDEYPDLKRIVVAIDPAITNKKRSDETGIVVIGIDRAHYCYVLEDLSCKASPNGWAKIAVNAYKKYKADRIIGEVNQGGDMVGNTIRTIDKNVSYGSVRATRGKEIRAEPVMALYEQGKVYHLHGLDKLENQLTTWDPETNNKSPDRLDALVWGLTELMLDIKDLRPTKNKPAGF